MGAHPFNSPNNCPAIETLVGFSSGELPDPVFETVAMHLSRCGTCLAVIADLHARPSKDCLEEKVRDCLGDPGVRRKQFDALDSPMNGDTDVTVKSGKPTPKPAQPPEDVAGKQIGRYVLMKRLGEGGMGVVYLASDPQVGRLVALKMLTVVGGRQQERIDRFRTEGQALARLRHPNVVQFYHFDEHEGRPYYTMEHVPGGTLEGLLRRGSMPVRQAAEIIQTLAVAIHAVHQEQVIHRDLKPANILFAADGTIKIADFGLAKIMDASDGQDRTKSGLLLGSLFYISPEQAAGRPDEIDCRTDVYALGAVFYALLTGRPPYEGATMFDTLQLVAKADLYPPSLIRPEIPKDLEQICSKCLARTRSDRYATAQELADDLTDWLEGRHPRSLPGRVRQALRITRRRALAAGIGLAAVSIGAVAYRRDPDRVLREIEASLRAGRPVSLIGETGKPQWSRWVTNHPKTQQTISDDGMFNIRMPNETSLLELLPDPQTDSYRLDVQIRHEGADSGQSLSGVGIFVGRHDQKEGATPTHFFMELSFNDIWRNEDHGVIIINGKAQTRPENKPRLIPHIYAPQLGTTPEVDLWISGVRGSPFTPAGPAGDQFRSLALIVRPTGIEAEWDGQKFAFPAQEIQAHVERNRRGRRPVNYTQNPGILDMEPKYSPRGGLGLLVMRGAASFRSCTITPLDVEGNSNV
ncbi:serine/threonine protein kinase [Zavarzinella formosa]|uniref:serine/threonine protein kinase n=1 Tax=Zavarzinella formosa TaxID=360055 RepID=UPI0002E6E587|nr:serine/threonine-protein kinase [Zavarzinella formosa]